MKNNSFWETGRVEVTIGTVKKERRDPASIEKSERTNLLRWQNHYNRKNHVSGSCASYSF